MPGLWGHLSLTSSLVRRVTTPRDVVISCIESQRRYWFTRGHGHTNAGYYIWRFPSAIELHMFQVLIFAMVVRINWLDNLRISLGYSLMGLNWIFINWKWAPSESERVPIRYYHTQPEWHDLALGRDPRTPANWIDDMIYIYIMPFTMARYKFICHFVYIIFMVYSDVDRCVSRCFKCVRT